MMRINQTMLKEGLTAITHVLYFHFLQRNLLVEGDRFPFDEKWPQTNQTR
jgi:hypothetical protein